MTRFQLFFAFVLLLSFFAIQSTVFAQNEPVMYFCEKYGRKGEIGVSDRFTTGYLTVMVKADYALGLDDVAIQVIRLERLCCLWQPTKEVIQGLLVFVALAQIVLEVRVNLNALLHELSIVLEGSHVVFKDLV